MKDQARLLVTSLSTVHSSHRHALHPRLPFHRCLPYRLVRSSFVLDPSSPCSFQVPACSRFYGITLGQTWFYFRTFQKDPLAMRLLVRYSSPPYFYSPPCSIRLACYGCWTRPNSFSSCNHYTITRFYGEAIY